MFHIGWQLIRINALLLCFGCSQLAQHIHRLRVVHSDGIQGKAVDIETIARELLALGYLVQLRDEAQQDKPRDTRSCLQQLRHRFIVCIGVRPSCDAEPQYLAEPLVVEPRFREQFAIAHPTAAYEAMLQVGGCRKELQQHKTMTSCISYVPGVSATAAHRTWVTCLSI